MATPLSDLACLFNGETDASILDAAGLPEDYEITKGERHFLRTDQEWLDMEDTGKVMEFIHSDFGAETQKLLNDSVNIPNEGFNPKFMLVIDQRNSKTSSRQ